MIKAIIFDWGGVLIDLPSKKIVSYCAKHLGIKRADLTLEMDKNARAFYKGKITEGIYWTNICAGLNIKKPKVKSLWGPAFAYAYRPKRAMFNTVSRLYKNGYKTAILSDTELPSVKFFNKQSYKFFSSKIFSCLEGTIKHEKKIFKTALNKLKVKPEEAVFIDDRESIIDIAKKQKINTIYYKNYSQFVGELKKLLSR